MKTYILALSITVSFVMTQSVSVPVLDNIIEMANLVGSIPPYLNKTK